MATGGKIASPGAGSSGLRAHGRLLGRWPAAVEGDWDSESARAHKIWGVRGAREETGRAKLEKRGPKTLQVGAARAPRAACSTGRSGGGRCAASAPATDADARKGGGRRPLSSSCRLQAQGDPRARPSQATPTLRGSDRAWG